MKAALEAADASSLTDTLSPSEEPLTALSARFSRRKSPPAAQDSTYQGSPLRIEVAKPTWAALIGTVTRLLQSSVYESAAGVAQLRAGQPVSFHLAAIDRLAVAGTSEDELSSPKNAAQDQSIAEEPDQEMQQNETAAAAPHTSGGGLPQKEDANRAADMPDQIAQQSKQAAEQDQGRAQAAPDTEMQNASAAAAPEEEKQWQEEGKGGKGSDMAQKGSSSKAVSKKRAAHVPSRTSRRLVARR